MPEKHQRKKDSDSRMDAQGSATLFYFQPHRPARGPRKNGIKAKQNIQKAVKLVMGETVDARRERLAAPAAPAAPAAKLRDLNKAVDAANRQPPNMSERGVNKDDTKINISQLSDEEFDKLPLSKQRELRGDFA